MPFCSWCLKSVEAKLAEPSILTRNLLRCPKCHHTVVKCRACENYACWDSFTVATGTEKKRIEQHDQFCAEHRHVVRNFETLRLKLDSPDQYRRVYDFHAANLAQIGTVTLCVLGGIAIGGPLAFAAGPAIGGALGSAMGLSGAAAASAGLATIGGGSLAAGGLGMAGGLAIISVVGVAVGGSLGAYVAGEYLSDIKDFEIYKVRDGKSPAIITVNGFLTQRGDAHEGWLSGVDHRYRDHEWYHVEWEAKNLASLGSLCVIRQGREALKKVLTTAAAKASKEAAKKINAAATALQILALSTNPWHVALVKAEKTGVILADILRRCRKRQFILIGHSLGCRVIYSCMQTLATTANPIISESQLLAGAVGDDSANWRAARRSVIPNGRINNYHSDWDYVLRLLYSAGTFFQSTPIGRNGIRRVGGICNQDLSRLRLRHMHYKPRLQEFLLPSSI